MDNITVTIYKSIKKSSILNFFIYIMVLLASLDIFIYYFSKYLKGISFYGVLSIILILILSKFRYLKVSIFHGKQIIFFIIWVIFFIIVNQFIINYTYSNVIMGINFNDFTLQVIQVFCTFITYFYLDSVKAEKVKVNIIKIILFSIFIDAVITLRALQIDFNISKVMATGSAALNVKGLKGVSGYSIIYGLVIIMPMLYCCFKEYGRRYQVIKTLLIMLIIYFVYKAAYTTALIALVLGILIYLFLNMSKKLKILLLPLIILMIILLINPKLIYNILTFLSDKIEISQISERFQELANLILHGDKSGDTLYRFVLYKRSINAFFSHPLFGISIFKPNYLLSGHSAFLDILGSMGLFGFIPYFLFILYSYKISMNKTKEKKLKNSIRTSYIIFCFIGSINTLATSFTINLFLLFFINWYPIFIEKLCNKNALKVKKSHHSRVVN